MTFCAPLFSRKSYHSIRLFHEYLVKTQVHKIKNASSEKISTHLLWKKTNWSTNLNYREVFFQLGCLYYLFLNQLKFCLVHCWTKLYWFHLKLKCLYYLLTFLHIYLYKKKLENVHSQHSSCLTAAATSLSSITKSCASYAIKTANVADLAKIVQKVILCLSYFIITVRFLFSFFYRAINQINQTLKVVIVFVIFIGKKIAYEIRVDSFGISGWFLKNSSRVYYTGA